MSGVSVIKINRAEHLLRRSFYTTHAALLDILMCIISRGCEDQQERTLHDACILYPRTGSVIL